MIANHTERQDTHKLGRTHIRIFSLQAEHVGAMGGASLPHLAADEGRMLEISCQHLLLPH